MNQRQKAYSEEFKREAVRLSETSPKPITEVARELGVSVKNVYRWREQYSSPPALVQRGAATISELEAELRRLRRENEVLKQERDILKKAMSIVSRSQP
jgi:transposase